MLSNRKVDVLVVGGGPAGMGAAIGAARAGAKVLLLERYGFLGGVASWGMGMRINQMIPGGSSRGVVHELVIDQLKRYGDDALMYRGPAGLVCNVEYLKVALMDALDAVDCPYLLHSMVVDTLREGDRATGAVVGTKQGLVRIDAGATVDATGDADVAFFAGAETMKGGEDDGPLSPMTLNFFVVNVGLEGASRDAGSRINRVMTEARDEYPLLPQRMSLRPFPIKNCLTANHAGTKLAGSLDGTDPAQMTVAESYSRRQALQVIEALRKYAGPEFANVQLAATGPQPGVRETRRVKGSYILTEEDAMTGARFDDAIAWRSGRLDIGFTRLEDMKVHDVPYRSIVPEQVDGLLVAGRCISATHVGASAGKSMGNCMATGHAAGLAAAMAVTKGCQPRELAVREIQDALRADGVDLAYEGKAFEG